VCVLALFFLAPFFFDRLWGYVVGLTQWIGHILWIVFFGPR
jgi:hypothetical protein